MSKDINVKMLEIAKELLMLEYHDKKAQDHNRWLIESEKAWVLSRTKLEHPPFPPFPTETLILEKARSLMEFVDSQTSKEEKLKSTIEPVKEESKEEPKNTEDISTNTVAESVVEVKDEPVVEVKPEIIEEVKEEVKELPPTENKAAPAEVKPNSQQIEELENDGQKIPEMKKFNLPDNLLAYTRIKVANEIENRTPSSTRIITNILDSLKRNKK